MRDVERLLAAFFNFDVGLAIVEVVALWLVAESFEGLTEPDPPLWVLSHSSYPPSSLRGGRLDVDFAVEGGGGTPDPDFTAREAGIAVTLEGGIFACSYT